MSTRFYIHTIKVEETQNIMSLEYLINDTYENEECFNKYSIDEVGIEFHNHPCNSGMTINFYITKD